ncbi:hypothetical protein [Natrinema salifodinae]|uniref:Uncharacterized protein n=1 Tax=Natrinema salifodinae TaxID=1202768 RepID=A0A1I0LZF2_9EURY|nr:hypothetical protein [Natrinema salifodinae]SEV80719.1 hypothetical protein SAMN05216285_0143 [Natrinema salifodinae]
MTMQTYRLEIREAEANGIDADVYNEDGTVEASTRVAYDDFDLDPPGSRDDEPNATTEVTADVTTLDLQYERDDAGFAFRLLGDRDELTSIRIDDEEWGLA